MTSITATNFNFPKQKNLYKGKVRDVYNINDSLLVMVASIEYLHLMLFCQKSFQRSSFESIGRKISSSHRI